VSTAPKLDFQSIGRRESVMQYQAVSSSGMPRSSSRSSGLRSCGVPSVTPTKLFIHCSQRSALSCRNPIVFPSVHNQRDGVPVAGYVCAFFFRSTLAYDLEQFLSSPQIGIVAEVAADCRKSASMNNSVDKIFSRMPQNCTKVQVVNLLQRLTAYRARERSI
jgi:hypothetical protein